MLHVVEVDYPTLAFGGGEFFTESLSDANQLFNRLVKFAHVGNHSGFVGQEIFIAQIFQLSLVAVAQIFNRGFDRIVALAQTRRLKVDGVNFIVQRIPIAKRGLQVVELIEFVHYGVGGDVISFSQFLSLRAGVENFLQCPQNVGLEKFKPSGVVEAGVFGQIVGRGERIKPRVGVRHTQRKVVQVDNHFVKLVVAVDVAAEFVREILKRRVGIIFLEKLFDDFALEQEQFVIVALTKFRVEVDA